MGQSLLLSIGSAALAYPLNMRSANIRSGLPGTHTVPGISPGDILVAAYQRPLEFHTIIAGDVDGTHTVVGIQVTDRLVQVYEEDGTSGITTDLTGEFIISGPNQVTNFITDTTGDQLIIVYEKNGLDFLEDVTITGDNEITTVNTAQAQGTQWEIAWVDVT